MQKKRNYTGTIFSGILKKIINLKKNLKKNFLI